MPSADDVDHPVLERATVLTAAICALTATVAAAVLTDHLAAVQTPLPVARQRSHVVDLRVQLRSLAYGDRHGR